MEVLASDYLRAFRVFADRLNFTTAARFLHISQPALHVKIQKLSHALGETLYERNGRHLVLTPAGEVLATFARDESARVEHFVGELKGFVGRPLVLAAGRGTFLNVIDAAVAAELRRGTNLRLVVDHAIETARMVETGTADVAVGVFGRVSPRLILTPIGSYGQVLVVPRSHSWASRDTIHMRDLDGLALVVPPTTWPHRIMLASTLEKAGVDWSVAVDADGWDLMLHFAKLGVAPAVVNTCVRVPAGAVGIPIVGLPDAEYFVVTRRGASEAVVGLVDRFRANTQHSAEGALLKEPVRRQSS